MNKITSLTDLEKFLRYKADIIYNTKEKPIIIPYEEFSKKSIEEVFNLVKTYELYWFTKPDDTPLEDLDLSVRAYNCVKAAKITSLTELVNYSKEELLNNRNFGIKSLQEIESILAERGLSFRNFKLQ